MKKLYSVHDHWTDINKKNDVDIESIDGVISGIKVNGEDYSGGGESDLSIATMTCTGSFGTVYAAIAEDVDNRTTGSSGGETLHIILYKGQALIEFEGDILSTSGSIEDLGRDGWLVTGDCTVNFAKL